VTVDFKLLALIIIVWLGLILGSFINAWVWRTRNDRSVAKGRSACPKCHHQLAWYDLLPVLSYIALRGKCRYCKAKISAQYPLVELGTAVLFGLLYWQISHAGAYGWAQFVLILAISILLVAGFVYDALYMELPEKYMLPAIALGVISLGLKAYQNGWDMLVPQLIGLGCVVLFYTALWYFSGGKWLGAGDIRIAAVMGLILQPKQLVVALFFTYIVGAAYGMIVLSKSKQKRGIKVPFGPFMIIGLYIGLLSGNAIANWYLGLL
jgi:prepilin signal peptidase PulO-like enzyme (type II secretory pathway)